MQSGAAPALTGLAVVDVGVAVAAGEAGPAGAAVAPVGVLACGPIPAGALHTLIDVNLTGLTWGQSRTGIVCAGGADESPRGDNDILGTAHTRAEAKGRNGCVSSTQLSHGAGQDPPQGLPPSPVPFLP